VATALQRCLIDAISTRSSTAARVIVVCDGRVLLFECLDPGDLERGTFWFTAGGGINPGEALEAAALRELEEEAGLRLAEADLGPVVATRRALFDFEGTTYDQHESYFFATVADAEIDISGWDEIEQRSMLGHRWWSIEDLRATNETVHPRELADVVGQLLRDGAPATPIELG
jgi:8-oxo-dGTP pyrophosphatase MutT (NUDIX family)